MIVEICMLFLCPGTLRPSDLASEKETRKSLNQERERERDRRPFSYIKKAQSSHIVIVSLTGTHIQQFQ